MAINLNMKMVDELDQPIKSESTGKETTLADLLIIALSYPDASQEDKQERWQAIKDIKSFKGLSQEQKELCKKWVNKVFLSPVVTGRILDELGE